MKYLYTPYDVAVFCLYADFTSSDERVIVSDIWENSKGAIPAKYRDNLSLYKREISLERFKLEDMQGDLDQLNLLMSDTEHAYCVDGTLDEQGIIESYFKIIKLSLTHIEGCDYRKIKLRRMLRQFGYKRRSPQLVASIKRTLSALELKTYLRVYVPCDVSDIDVDDMIMIRLK